MSAPTELGDDAPLAARLRPTRIEEFVGQQHLLGPDRPLRRLIESGRLQSLILWGPPGTGKTTLARLLVRVSGARLVALSAVTSGVRDIRAAVAEAEALRGSGTPTALFIDEVHRFNKSQQDALLPHVEAGTVVLIGATTENPSFEVNGALLSRTRVYVLQPLQADDLLQILDRGAGVLEVRVSVAARQLLVDLADGDGRRLLNLLELAAQLAGDDLEAADVEAAAGSRYRRFDKGGDAFYDQISALHKAVRGSDVDAALYWFARMIDGGVDPLFVARRLLRMASEDIGNADPRGLQLALAGFDTYQRLGSPEGELALAQVVVYLASMPKSNAVYRALQAAQALVAESPSLPVPLHLRNAPTRLAKSLGHGQGYRYAHDEPDAYAAGEHYWPEGFTPVPLYEPTSRGLEAKIAEHLSRLRARDKSG